MLTPIIDAALALLSLFNVFVFIHDKEFVWAIFNALWSIYMSHEAVKNYEKYQHKKHSSEEDDS